MECCCFTNILPRWSRRRGYEEIGDDSRNKAFEKLYKEHSHLDVTRRLTIGKLVTDGGFSPIYQGTLKATRCSRFSTVVAIKLLHNVNRSDDSVKVGNVSDEVQQRDRG
jgi:hypothetical protein